LDCLFCPFDYAVGEMLLPLGKSRQALKSLPWQSPLKGDCFSPTVFFMQWFFIMKHKNLFQTSSNFNNIIHKYLEYNNLN
jgi:hypothetical protein